MELLSSCYDNMHSNDFCLNQDYAGMTTFSDSDGQYRLRYVPSGEQTISAKLVGFHPLEVNVSVNPGEVTELHIELEHDFISGERVHVDQLQHQSSPAYSNQFLSQNPKHILTYEQLHRFADLTAQDALTHFPGMQAGMRKEINFRGIGRNRFNVTLDGQRFASTGLGSRDFDPGTVPVDGIREIEVISVNTPDMDADALSGTVNIVRKRPAGGQRFIDARLGGDLQLSYQPLHVSTFRLISRINQNNQTFDRHRNNWITGDIHTLCKHSFCAIAAKA